MANKKNRKTIRTKKTVKKRSLKYAWLSFIFALFFWIPILNVVFILPASMYFGAKAAIKSRKEPEKYGGFFLAIFSTTFAFLSFVYGLYILLVSLSGTI